MAADQKQKLSIIHNVTKEHNMSSRIVHLIAAITGMSLTSVAAAHSGHGDSLAAGIAHPFLGLDHALAMLAVGLWAYHLGSRARVLVPASFVALMALGGGLAIAGVVIPFEEIGIASSVLLLGALVAFMVRVPAFAAAALAGIFAVFHGYAHVIEMPVQQIQWAYVTGFVCATAALHLIGMGIAVRLKKQQMLLRMTGVSVAAIGGLLLSGTSL